MDKSTDILKRVRRIELRARNLATENLVGHYRSGFRGQGLDFDDFREYLAGDEPRFIDWKVTARMNQPYVRRFHEEREQALIIAVDVSGSMHYASAYAKSSKLDYAAELAAVLAFSAAQNGDKCGLLLFGGDRIRYIPPAKGMKQVLRIIREIITCPNLATDANIGVVARQLITSQKKSAMVVMLSDFWCEPNKSSLGQINFKHDFIPIRIVDPAELNLPEVGRVCLKDPETEETLLVNLSNTGIELIHNQVVEKHRAIWSKDFLQLGIDFLDLQTTDNFIPVLKALFIRRTRKLSH